jgi:asparagine synthase (glutamine-hydrolysing)
MSAIFGILRFDGEAAAPADLERMAGALRHRGPDGRRIFADGPVGLGHGLMRVTGEDLFEAQPLRDAAAGLTLVADARIDNREELAAALGIGADTLADRPDSALILAAYKAWGEDCAERLVGDFAFAVWDAPNRKLALVRDHMGQRSILFHQGTDFFVFASEWRGLWAVPGAPRRLSEREVARFFHKTVYERPEGVTRFEGVSAVLGGEVATITPDGALARRRYWTPHADPAHEHRDEAYYVEAYRRVLAEAVACRLRRLTRPAALLMSAGFDTAAIAGLARPAVDAQRRKLISLSSLGIEGVESPRGDVSPWLEACRRVMPHLDVRTLTRPVESPLDGVERIFLSTDGPGGGDRKTTDHLFAQASAAGARVVMDGYGGDYTLNPRAAGALAMLLRSGRFGRFISELGARRRVSGQPLWRLVRHEVILPLLPWPVIHWQRTIRRLGAFALLHSGLREIEGPALRALRRRNEDEAQGEARPPTAAMRLAMRRLAARISRSAAAPRAIQAAAHGLDLTRPFHDKRVVELGLAVPETLFLKHGRNRHLARMALADVYPPEFQTRGHANEGALGDVYVLETARPALMAEAERMSHVPALNGFFDFVRVKAILAEPDHRDKLGVRKAAAVRALVTARFVEWFGDANA